MVNKFFISVCVFWNLIKLIICGEKKIVVTFIDRHTHTAANLGHNLIGTTRQFDTIISVCFDVYEDKCF